jgi:hypothetical protein
MPDPQIPRPRRLLEGIIRIAAGAFLLAGVAYFLAGLLPVHAPFLRLAPLVSNSVTRMAGLALCALYAAGNLRERRGLLGVLAVAHLLSVAALAVLLLRPESAGAMPVGPWVVPIRTVLRVAMIVDGAWALLSGLFLHLASDRFRREEAGVPAPDAELTPAESGLRTTLRVLTVAFAAAVVMYELGPFLTVTRPWFVALPLTANSATKVGIFALLCFYVARDLRGRMPVIGVVVTGHVVSIVIQAIYAIFRTGTERTILLGGVGLDLVLTAVLFALYQRAWTARYGLVFLRPMEFRCLMALSEVLVTGPEKPATPVEVAAAVDGYIERIRARRRIIHRVALFALEIHPTLSFKPPLSQLDAEQRLQHLETHFIKARRRHGPMGRLRAAIQSGIRIAQQLVYIGYYSHPAVQKQIGYRVFSQRARFAGLHLPKPRRHPLEVMRAEDVAGGEIEADVCIIGSGAAGGTLAYHLAAAGRSVLVVERGRYVEPREFSEDEVDMIGKLYADGVFQQSEDFKFTVLQGSCVGGSTVVNNGVCFDPPADVLARWFDSSIQDSGIPPERLADALATTRHLMRVTPQAQAVLNPTGEAFMRGVDRIDPLKERLERGPVEANIEGCVGCGYCNTGCAYGRKLSMLDHLLPAAQLRHPGKVRILAECPIDRLTPRTGPKSHVTAALGTLSDGRRIRIRARTFVVSAGTIASSYLLQRSGIGRDLPVGRQVSFNMGAAITAEFPDGSSPGLAHDGLQISHYGRPVQPRGYVYETWWNPPVAQALNMPGWFADHYGNMRRYADLMAVGVLVGTEARGTIGSALTGGPAINFEPSAKDLDTMSRGLAELGGILFAAGASRLMVNGWRYHEFHSPRDLEHLAALARKPGALAFGSGHPQGGNAISRDTRRGVVGPDFRVHGYDNLFVCDASVFPSSLTVNPQLTVMTLATHAAEWIA